MCAAYTCLGQTKNKSRYYNDTTFEFNGYTIGLKNTYNRKKLFLRTTLEINNPSKNFVLINPKDIFLSASSLTQKPSLYRKTIVVPPGHSLKFPVKFPDVSSEDSLINFSFSKITISKDVITAVGSGSLAIKNRKQYKDGNVKVEIIDVKEYQGDVLIRVKISYKGNGFLAVNYNNIAAKNEKADTCYNLKKPVGKAHINPKTNIESVNLVFPRRCLNINARKTMFFKNVFTELSIEDLSGFETSLRIIDDKDIPLQKEKDDIETMD